MIEILLLITAVSIDSFAAAVGIGGSGIKIPLRSAVIISFIGTLFLSCSVAFAEIIKLAVPETVCGIISFMLLIALGIFNLFQNFFKRLLSRRSPPKTNPVMLFFDGTAADTDNSKSISPREAVTLAVALSADSLVTGVSAGLSEICLPLLAFGAFAAGMLSICIGCLLGRKIISTLKINLGWLCGAVLILLAFIH